MTKVAILQSNYLPWKGYFGIAASVDLFIFHDDLQYTKGDWRNRNVIKTQNGPKWLTIPCGTDENRLICEVVLSDSSWQKKHWLRMEEAYKKAPFFAMFKDYFKEIFLGKVWQNLSELNQHLICDIAKQFLAINCSFEDSRNYNLQFHKGERVIELLKKSHAIEYISGPAAKVYLREADFIKNNISLTWFDYSGYPAYGQLYPPFQHDVSIVDLLFNTGGEARYYLKRNTCL